MAAKILRLARRQNLFLPERGALICEALQLLKERMEESEFVAAGLMRLPPEKKNNDFLDLPAPQVSRAGIQATIRAERDEE